MFLYLANTYKNYLTKNKVNVYGSKKVKLPVPELYVIYAGKDKIKNKTISLNKEYINNKSPIDLKIKTITETEFYESEIYENGKAEGIQQGTLNAIINMLKKGIIKLTDAAKELGVSEKEFMRLAEA